MAPPARGVNGGAESVAAAASVLIAVLNHGSRGVTNATIGAPCCAHNVPCESSSVTEGGT
jgi:hypothetical protein